MRTIDLINSFGPVRSFMTADGNLRHDISVVAKIYRRGGMLGRSEQLLLGSSIRLIAMTEDEASKRKPFANRVQEHFFAREEKFFL